MAAGAGALLARLAPALTRVAGTEAGAAVKQGALQGIAGRTANLVQGQKDGQSKGSQHESLEGWFPGK